MLFRRRSPLGIVERAKRTLWPASGWKRTFSYLGKRVLRLNGTPHAIAAGFAAGVFASFTPFIFFHFLISIVVAFLIGGNMLAALLGTAVGNPLTFPAIYLSSYNVGNFLLGRDYDKNMPHEMSESLFGQSWDVILPLLQPLVIGGLPLGIGFGAVAYFVVLLTVRKYQKSRRQRLEARRKPSGQHSNVETSESV